LAIRRTDNWGDQARDSISGRYVLVMERRAQSHTRMRVPADCMVASRGVPRLTVYLTALGSMVAWISDLSSDAAAVGVGDDCVGARNEANAAVMAA
jgi:hypothetical protein